MNYSEDEFAALLIAGILAVSVWAIWYYSLGVTQQSVRPTGNRRLLGVTPIISAVLLLIVLHRWSAEDVRNDEGYVVFYMVLGAAWVGLFTGQLALWGLSVRDDVLERGNNAAAWCCAGAIVAFACCFAGANVGNGPGWWVVLFSAGLSTLSLLLLWLALHAASGLAEKVSVDRDGSAGLRAAGFFIGNGLILGRAVAGDWVSASATTLDFARTAWPALILTGTIAAVERSCQPNYAGGGRAFLVSGLLPGSIYVFAGVIALLTI